ncbi:MAG TPA: patatin-like phospholipase family protein [Thermoanaerobaculia bacterium]|nr:patatin-like phospholipase family protein [Thermoanaerobaculia bacterium]
MYPADDQPRPRALSGLALSGGGIRSATFNLGLLQALKRHGLLQRFDYLSTVSGGGYCGGWWSAWLSRGSREKGDFFPPDERIEPERHEVRHADEVHAHAKSIARDYKQMSDSALNAGSDPIHHLRLFSNFLTPRKGLLSADTWRAIAVISRNLVLTWLVLLPLMLAAIMSGQAYFALATENAFEYRIDLDDDIDTFATSADYRDADERAEAARANAGTHEKPATRERVLERLRVALVPPLVLLIGVVFCVILWMLGTRQCWKLRDVIAVVLTGVAFVLLTVIALMITQTFPRPKIWIAFGGVSAFFAIVLLIAGARKKRKYGARVSDGDFWRNQLVRFQTTLLQWSVISAVVLLFSGFGHDAIDFLLYSHTAHHWVGGQVARAGGWGGIILTLLGAAYTALRGSPSGGDDTKQAKPKTFDRIVFAIVPPLLLFLLAVWLAWVGHRFYAGVYEDGNGEIWYITIATMISAFLFLSMAMYEFRPRSPGKMLALVLVWLALALGAYFVPREEIELHLVSLAAGSAVFIIGALLVRGPVGRRHWAAIASCAALGVAVGFALSWTESLHEYTPLPIARLPYVVLIGIALSIALLLFELVWGEGSNARSFALMLIGFLMFALIAVGACIPDALAWRAVAMFGCISSVLGWVLALGWLADPNVLTVHGFYKSRLVRAYMGASNDERAKARETDVTDAVPDDDVALKNLRNTDHGAPYHLINTTLNLVGGRDLATVQRFSDSFVMSKAFCGSLRTGYRRTDEYACGTLSLGAAVSVSGAAASPNMGGQTPSAALAMLLTLFNVRLGFWAPTPNRSYWRAGSARLWPFYTLQELLSQTTDLMPFCYLTDGGHFDNTGVYSLIQRGCRSIVFADCGADPRPCFSDLGDLVRKVRIDFGTEIDIDIEPLLATPPQSHFIVGTIRYGDAHADMLGLPKEERTGTIIVVKPNRTMGASVDVRQYGFKNDAFPQQTTADQWFDEQQFESYRRLGAISGSAMFEWDTVVRDAGEFFADPTLRKRGS